MTFEEALKLKNSIPLKQFNKHGYSHKILVVPLDKNNLTNYLQNVRENWMKLTDESSKMFSQDNQFTVYLIYTDLVDILYHSLQDY